MPRKKKEKIEVSKSPKGRKKKIIPKEEIKVTPETSPVTKKKISKPVFFQATGKRKTAIAQVRLFPQGKGLILINGKKIDQYFSTFSEQKEVLSPLDLTGQRDRVDLEVKVSGGGIHGQAEALRLGISRALIFANPEFRKILKPAGFLTRDARIKERKKPGLKRARRAPQWQKR